MRRAGSKTGQSLSEYGVVAVLVAVVSIAGLMGVSGDLNKLLSGLKGDMSAHKGQSHAITLASIPAATSAGGATDAPADPAASPGTPPATASAGSGSTLITLPNGTQIASSLPQSLHQSVETAGANGTAELLAQTIQQTGEQLFAAGQLTADQYNAVMALANTGHQVAQITGLIENRAAQCGNDSSCFNQPISFNGVTYPGPNELSKQVGWPDTGTSSPTDAQMQTILSSQPFWGADPDTLHMLNELSHNISEVGQMVQWETGKVATNPTQFPPSRLRTEELAEQAQWLPDKPLSDVVTSTNVANTKSATICTTGQGNTDSGTNCQSGG